MKVVSRLVLTASGPRGKEANADKIAGFPLEYPLHGNDGCKASFLWSKNPAYEGYSGVTLLLHKE